MELHHERPDGRGYPWGSAATTSRLAARIVHVADAYDAMTSARVRTWPGRAMAIEELWRWDADTASVEVFGALARAPRTRIGLPPPRRLKPSRG